MNAIEIQEDGRKVYIVNETGMIKVIPGGITTVGFSVGCENWKYSLDVASKMADIRT